MEHILRLGGGWILSDYFRVETAARKSGHRWADFTTALQSSGWRIEFMEDITANVLLTIACVHMWGSRYGLPLMQFATERLQRKYPTCTASCKIQLVERNYRFRKTWTPLTQQFLPRKRSA